MTGHAQCALKHHISTHHECKWVCSLYQAKGYGWILWITGKIDWLNQWAVSALKSTMSGTHPLAVVVSLRSTQSYILSCVCDWRDGHHLVSLGWEAETSLWEYLNFCFDLFLWIAQNASLPDLLSLQIKIFIFLDVTLCFDFLLPIYLFFCAFIC